MTALELPGRGETRLLCSESEETFSDLVSAIGEVGMDMAVVGQPVHLHVLFMRNLDE